MAGWNPWAAARAHPRLEIVYGAVPEGATWHRDHSGDRITIDERATRRERKALLAHELIHVERGIGHPVASAATMQREEAIVRRETAARLVPLADLAAFVDARATVEPITTWIVADEFDVPEAIALEALRALLERRRWSDAG